MQQMQHFALLLLAFIASALLVNAQNYPPRLSIPGALPVQQHARQPFRNEKPAPVVRIRRPIALRQQQSHNAIAPPIAPRLLDEPKPVTEAPEDDLPDVYLPQLLREQQVAAAQQANFHQMADAFFNGEPNAIQHEAAPISHLLQQQQHHERDEELAPPTPPAFAAPSRPQAQQTRPAFNDYGIGRFGGERPQAQVAPAPPPPQSPQRGVNVIRTTRPQIAREPARPQYEPAPAPVAARPRPKPIQARPQIEQNEERENAATRRQRPVAQTLRKWREENEDGSITWGYENDDGSFKEEIIGTDCVTKGTYGYIDPDGNKREYHYETGIKCDPNTRETDEELQENGFENYEENKAVLPNGIEIDMSQLGRKKSKRPGANFRN